MKKVLFGTTALVLSAGIAAADVSVGADGRMGVISTEGSDTGFTSRLRIKFAASGETDGGLSFGGSGRLDHQDSICTDDGFDVVSCSDTGLSNGRAGSVFIEGSFGKLSMGDVDSAAEQAVGDVSGVGLTGLGDYNETSYITANNDPTALYEYSTGDLSFYVSAGQPTAANQELSVGVSYGMGNFSFGLGYEDDETASHIVASASAGFGDATVKVVYGDASDYDFSQAAISLDYVFGATTATAFYRTLDNAGVDTDYYGIGASYDLGGGAALKGGIVDSDDFSDISYDFGVSMNF